MQTRKQRYRLDELKAKRVHQLREIASTLRVSISDCIDKDEIIRKLVDSGNIDLTEGAPAVEKTLEEFNGLSVGELKRLLLSFGLSSDGALEKAELRKVLLDSGRVVILEPWAASEANQSGGGDGSSGKSSLGSAMGGNCRYPTDSGMSSYSGSGSGLASNDYSASSKTASGKVGADNFPQSSDACCNKASGSGSECSSSSNSDSSRSVSIAELRVMSMGELKNLTLRYGISLAGCMEKTDVVERIAVSGKVRIVEPTAGAGESNTSTNTSKIIPEYQSYCTADAGGVPMDVDEGEEFSYQSCRDESVYKRCGAESGTCGSAKKDNDSSSSSASVKSSSGAASASADTYASEATTGLGLGSGLGSAEAHSADLLHLSVEELSAMPISELRALLSLYGLNTMGCIYREDMIQRLQDSGHVVIHT